LHFVEQAHIANCDHGLIREGLQQHDLAFGKRSGMSTSNGDRPDWITLMQ
jgi:hypothetical protein